MEELQVQRASKSVIAVLGWICAIAQGVLGIMLQGGVIEPDMVGAIMTALAGILGWAVGNNPNIAGTYAPKPDAQKK